MLHGYCSQFLAYCELADFSARSIQALTIRLNELANFLKIQRIQSVKKVRYRHLIEFTADFNAPSVPHPDEYNRLTYHFSERADSSMGLRNLIIIMLLGPLGLRTSEQHRGIHSSHCADKLSRMKT